MSKTKDSEEDSKVHGPDFICFGLQKAGTRWLYDQMNNRSDMWMPPVKEMNFFSGRAMKEANRKTVSGWRWRNDPFAKAFSDYEQHAGDVGWYKGLFRFKGERRSGDISPSYAQLTAREVGDVVRELPESKFIFLLREPLSRLWSALCMDVRKGLLGASELDDWDKLRRITRRKANKSFPSVIWENWSSNLPAERVRYWFLEDIRDRPEAVVDEICQFIGAAPGPGKVPADFNRKARDSKLQMRAEIRSKLIEHFSDEYARCAELFGSHALRWRESAETLT